MKQKKQEGQVNFTKFEPYWIAGFKVQSDNQLHHRTFVLYNITSHEIGIRKHLNNLKIRSLRLIRWATGTHYI